MPGKRLTDGATLPFTSGNHVGFAFSQMADFKQFKQFVNFPFIHGGKSRIVIKVQMGKKCIILKDITQAAFLRRKIDATGRVKPDLILKHDPAFLRRGKSCQHADNGCFPPTRRADEDKHFFGGTGKGNIQIKIF